MNREEIVKQLREMRGADPEVEHGKADQLLTDFLRDIGYSDIADAYDDASANFWYA